MKKKITSCLLAASLLTSLNSLTAYGVNPLPSESLDVPVAYSQPSGISNPAANDLSKNVSLSYSTRSKQDIVNKYKELGIHLGTSFSGNKYDELPSATAPYKAGSLTDEYEQDALNGVNFIRYIAGLPDDIKIGTRAEEAQCGAVLLNASEFDHYPSKPADMDEEFYEKGLSNTSRSNIGWGHSDLQHFNFDCADDSMISSLGHRRWLLNPNMMYTNFGNSSKFYTTDVFGNSPRTEENAIEYDHITWPCEGYFPAELSPSVWSVSLNPEKYSTTASDKSNITVKLTRISDNKQWIFDSASSGGFSNYDKNYFNVDNWGYGEGTCIIFRPSNTYCYNPYDKYNVTITGLKLSDGSSSSLSYDVEFFNLLDSLEPTTKIIGDDRYDTAVKVSQNGWNTSDSVMLVNGLAIPDALSVTPFAYQENAPILLTQADELNQTTRWEINRLGAKKVYLIGGTGVLSENLENEIKQMGLEVERLSGANRETTAVAIAKKLKNSSKAVVVNGYTGLADATSIGSTAASMGMPILLCNTNNADICSDYIKNSSIKTAFVIGGEGVISSNTASRLNCTTERIGGANRNDTNAHIIQKFYPEKNLQNIFVCKDGAVSSNELIDSLSVGVLAARENSPVILGKNSLTESQKNALKNKTSEKITQVGGGCENVFNELVQLFN